MLTDAVVLAAGNSTRIASVAGGLPKPLLPVQGEPILARNIRWLAQAGVRRVWVNLHYRGDLIRAALGEGMQWGVRIDYSEEPIILGTAGGVRKVLPSLAPTFFVVYGDNLVQLDLAALSAIHAQQHADVTIAVFDAAAPNTGVAGGRVQVNDDGSVKDFTEGAGGDTSGFVNAGVYVLERSILKSFPQDQFLDFGKDVFPALLARTPRSRVFAHRIDGYCLGLDTPASYERGMALISSGQVRLS
jgi:mannose-1-phosphate guanylyltransferase